MNTENACIGHFNCSVDMLKTLMGLPDSTTIKHVQMVPYGIAGRQTVRFVVEDSEHLSPVEDGCEIQSLSPQYRIGGNLREFLGFKIMEEPPDPDAEEGEAQSE